MRCAVRFRLGLGLLAALFVGAGCEQRRFEAALARDTVDGYLGFLARHGSGDRSREIRARLEEARWKQVRDASSIYGLRRYLADYPEGRYAVEARSRLARLRFERAKSSGSSADLRRFLATEPDEELARAARSILGRQELQAAMGRGGVTTLRAALEEFGHLPEAREAQAELVRREFLEAGDDAERLERFIARRAGSPEAARARARLAELEARALRAGPADSRELARFRERYPDYPGLAALEERVAARLFACASGWLDEAALATFAKMGSRDGNAAAAVRLLGDIRRRPAAASRVRALVRAALPYRPKATLQELEKKALGASFDGAMAAIADLGHAPEPEAALLLLDLATGPQLVVAERAVETLLERCARGGAFCSALASRGRMPRTGEPEGLRLALVRLASGDERGALQALLAARVTGEMPGRGRILPTILLARLRLRHGPAEQARLDVERALQEAAAHEQAVERLFPVQVERDRIPEALLAVHVAAALARLVGSVGTQEAVEVSDRLRGRVRQWEERLRLEIPSFTSTDPARHASVLRDHERDRGRALERLSNLARTEPLARGGAALARDPEGGLCLPPGDGASR